MKKKIVGIFVCTLLIAAAVLPAAGVMNDTDTKVGMLPSNNFLIQSNGNEGCSLLNWSERQKLVASDGESYDYFGWSVSIDGDYAIVGEWGDDKDNGDYRDLSGSAKGSAYVFK
ncbi:MAG: FG-GAP repeat protein, partial [Thermoplasmatales archaeon]|nr:FG-GAP repeat protein [Thermoplasmatales archaeon]